MNWSTIISAVISALTALVIQGMAARAAAKQKEVADAVKEAELKAKLASIEEKLDEHNGYAQKLGDIAVSLAEIRNDINWLRERS